MSLCPKCKTDIPDTAFGIYTCVKCRSVLSIDFDGKVNISDEPNHRSITASTSAPTQSLMSEPLTPLTNVGQDSEKESREIDQKVLQPEASEKWSEESSAAFLGNQLNNENDFNETPFELNREEPHQLENSKQKPATTDFEDIVAFGNSELSQGASGNFLYNILIAEIDSEDLRAAVREALTDKRFAWNADDIMKKLKSGTVKIERVNAVKASILVSRLKSFRLKISWSQNGIFEITP